MPRCVLRICLIGLGLWCQIYNRPVNVAFLIILHHWTSNLVAASASLLTDLWTGSTLRYHKFDTILASHWQSGLDIDHDLSLVLFSCSFAQFEAKIAYISFKLSHGGDRGHPGETTWGLQKHGWDESMLSDFCIVCWLNLRNPHQQDLALCGSILRCNKGGKKGASIGEPYA